jgi:P27 family predicted phage terminase small subunit
VVRLMARRGRKPVPKVMDHGSRAFAAQPRCPSHLTSVARKEWRRLAPVLHGIGVLKVADRAALAAYCQSYARWVEAEEKLRDTPMLLKTPSGYVQQSPWLSVANKQLELMGRYMSELGLTPVARARLDMAKGDGAEPDTKIEFITVYMDDKGNRQERYLDAGRSNRLSKDLAPEPHRIEHEERS